MLARSVGEFAKSAASGGKQARSTEVRSRRTRSVLNEFGKPLNLTEIESRRTQANLQVLARNGDAVTWISGDGVTVTFRGGLVAATRGLGEDLMSADFAATSAALARGGGTAARRTWRLDGENREVVRSYECQITRDGPETIETVEDRHATTRYTETCKSPVGGFTNTFWIGGDGTMWKSRQYITPGVGYILFERLVK